MTSYLALTSEQVKKAVEAVKKNKPVYAEILNFYGGVFDAQEACKGRIHLEPLQLSEELQNAKAREKLPLIEIEEFIYDDNESANLFLTLCHLAAETNPKLSAAAEVIFTVHHLTGSCAEIHRRSPISAVTGVKDNAFPERFYRCPVRCVAVDSKRIADERRIDFRPFNPGLILRK